jgi:membrane protein required for colicin V production
MLGLAFGFARGVLLILLGLALVRFGLPVEEDAWWQASRLVPIFNMGLDWILPKLLALSEGITDSVS